MPQLKTLSLYVATPRAPRVPHEVERSVTLPFLRHLIFSASARNCGLALAHLNLPALTCLYVAAKSLARMVATYKTSFRILHDTPAGPMTPNCYRACSSAATGRAPTFLPGPCLILTARYITRSRFQPPCPMYALHCPSQARYGHFLRRTRGFSMRQWQPSPWTAS